MLPTRCRFREASAVYRLIITASYLMLEDVYTLCCRIWNEFRSRYGCAYTSALVACGADADWRERERVRERKKNRKNAYQRFRIEFDAFDWKFKNNTTENVLLTFSSVMMLTSVIRRRRISIITTNIIIIVSMRRAACMLMLMMVMRMMTSITTVTAMTSMHARTSLEIK